MGSLCYIFSILPLGVYPPPKTIYNVVDLLGSPGSRRRQAPTPAVSLSASSVEFTLEAQESFGGLVHSVQGLRLEDRAISLARQRRWACNIAIWEEGAEKVPQGHSFEAAIKIR